MHDEPLHVVNEIVVDFLIVVVQESILAARDMSMVMGHPRVIVQSTCYKHPSEFLENIGSCSMRYKA